MKFLALMCLVFLSACQVKPTRTQMPLITPMSTRTADALLKLNPAILDTRPPFEFNMSHTPNAINVQWEDFSQSNPKFKGLLTADIVGVARRLALIGVDLDTPVVVLGKGSEGAGEEGRVAWTLKYLGVKQVFVAHYRNFREMNPIRELPAPIKNKAYWNPSIQKTWDISFTDLKKQLAAKDVVFLDVRKSDEFHLKNPTTLGVKTENIEWTHFFENSGVSVKVKERLASLQITPEQKIIVVSNRGVRSAAVTFALRELGYKKATNFSGGYDQWAF